MFVLMHYSYAKVKKNAVGSVRSSVFGRCSTRSKQHENYAEKYIIYIIETNKN